MEPTGFDENFAMTDGLPLGFAMGMAMNQLIERLGDAFSKIIL